ncbi:Uncharacterised protein [Streptococcus dysgalactiae subsp. equisimilis]|nr:Uncharacterised protein [Streptococcus dysgalactiae subsp. equisimilis]
MGADLYFQHLALRPDHRGMQRAVAVFFGVGDVVVEFLGNVPPQGMHDAQRGIAVAHLRNQHADGANVVDLAEIQALALHLAPDGVDVLRPSAEVGLHAGGGQGLLELAHHVGDVLLAIQSALVQQLGDLLVLVGLEVAEGQVFQFPLDMPDTQAVGQRCIDVEDFTGDAVALLLVGVLHRADRAGALGQFDQGDANVVDHRHQHLAQVLHLCLGAQHHGMARIEAGADRRHAQDALDQLGHHRPEALVDRLEGDLAFAYATVDDRGDQGLLVQLEVRENLGDLQARLETGGAFRPGVLCGDGSLFGFASELASLQQALTIEPGDEVLDVVQPGLEVDTAVGVDRLVRSHLYHLAYPLPRCA